MLGVFAMLAIGSGCARGLPDIIESHELSTAFGRPRITRIRDAGNARLPSLGPWKGEDDGHAVPGELIVIEGDNFGRQPAVTVGGRACRVLARTDGGGIVVRVPAGVPVGEVEVAVWHPKGRSEAKVKVMRLAVVVHDGKAWTLGVGRQGTDGLSPPIAVAGAREVRLSADGSAAYVLAQRPDGDRIVILDLAAPGGPALAGERVLRHRASLLATAQDADVLAALGDGRITLFSTTQPSRPAAWDPVELPKELPRAARNMELSPDGKVLAVLISEGNKLALLDVAPRLVRLVTTVSILPDARLPLVRDLAFSTDGETLWVVSGNNADSLPATEPTRLTAVRVLFDDARAAGAPPARLLSVWRTQTVPGASAPLHLAIARGQPLASGTTIRMPPEKAAVFVTSVSDALFKLADLDISKPGGAKSIARLWKPPQPGMMVRADISGGGGPLFATPLILSAVDLTPDAQLILATAARVTSSSDSVSLDFGVTVSPLWGTHTPTFIPLSPLSPSDLKPPFQIGDIRIQP